MDVRSYLKLSETLKSVDSLTVTYISISVKYRTTVNHSLVNNYPVAGHLQIRLATVIFFHGDDGLAEFSFQLRFGESPFFGGSG